MNKRAQFYLVAVLLLLVFAFSVLPAPSITPEPAGSFKQLHENFMSEVPFVVNRAVIENSNASLELETFTTGYLAYAKTRDPDFGLAYLFKDGAVLVINNQLRQDLHAAVGALQADVGPGTVMTLPSSSNATLQVAELSYSFSFSEPRELKILFKKEVGDDIQIRVEE